MVRGRLNKAQRGALIWNVPIGLEYDVLSGQIRLEADQSVRHAVELVFRLFRQLGSVRGVLTYLAREGLELPSQRLVRGVGRVISWQKPRYHVIYLMLTNPMYAGIYAYGRRQAQVDPLAHTRQVHRKARLTGRSFCLSIIRATSVRRNTKQTWPRLKTTISSFPPIRERCERDRRYFKVWCGASTVAARCASATMMGNPTTPVMRASHLRHRHLQPG